MWLLDVVAVVAVVAAVVVVGEQCEVWRGNVERAAQGGTWSIRDFNEFCGSCE